MEKKAVFTVSKSAYNPEVDIIKIDGFIDVNAAPEFEATLDSLHSAGRYEVLMDFSNVTYISSAGVGVIVGSLQAFRKQEQGDIKLFSVTPKIMQVFETIGINDVVDFLEQEKDVSAWVPWKISEDFEYFTLHILDNEIICGREFTLQAGAYTREGELAADYQGEPQLTISEGLITPKELKIFTKGLWQGKIIVTASGPLRLTVSDGDKQCHFQLEVKEEAEKANFPCQVTCRFCGNQAQVGGIEIYRCRTCYEIFYVDEWAHVIPLHAGNDFQPKLLSHKGIEIRINSDINYLTSLRRFIGGICEQENISAMIINELVLSTEEVLLNIIEHSYNFNSSHYIDVRIKISERVVEIRIRDQGRPFDITRKKQLSVKSIIRKGKKGGLGGIMTNQLMDKIRYHTFKNFNQLVMSKKRK